MRRILISRESSSTPCALLWALLCSSFLSLSISPLQEARSEPVRRYPLSYLERSLRGAPLLHLVTQYELGEVDWTERVLRTLGVGTHVILSPTGGWSQRDLNEVAIQSATQRLERLSVEVLKRSDHPSCASLKRSHMFQTPRIQWMSDGSVHLPAVVRFEVYERCDFIDLTPQSIGLTSEAEALIKLEESLRSGRRAVVYADLSIKADQGSGAPHFECISSSPKISLKNLMIEPLRWRAIRWLSAAPSKGKAHQDQAREQRSLLGAVKPLLKLGELRCTSRAEPTSQRGSERSRPHLLTAHQPSQRDLGLLEESLKETGGAELWIWVQR